MATEVLKYVLEAKEEFDRTLLCKHTSFDDLYPFMLEDQTFFWYKRHAMWSSLQTAVKIADGLGQNWQEAFAERQVRMIQGRILDKKVLDEWLGQEAAAEENETVE